MLTIQIISTVGACYRMEVSQIEFVRVCPYGNHEFTTIDPDQIFCKAAHRSNHWHKFHDNGAVVKTLSISA